MAVFPRQGRSLDLAPFRESAARGLLSFSGPVHIVILSSQLPRAGGSVPAFVNSVFAILITEQPLCYGGCVPRPRVHDLDAVMDAAERLAVTSGPSAVTIRAISATTGVSNGAIYHGFGSRAGLLGRVWLRAAERFLLLQREAVEATLSNSPSGEAAVQAVVVAADAPAIYLEQYPTGGRFLLTVRRDELIGSSDIPADVATGLRTLDKLLGDLFAQLARRLWDRDDRHAIGVMRECIVELPGALLLRGNRTTDLPARQRLSAAVRAVLEVGPPPVRQQPIRKRRRPT